MTLLQKVEEFIFKLHKDRLSKQHTYHDFSHTMRVVNAAKELIKGENLSEKDANNLIIAAWFHDSGYLIQQQNHEQEGAKIARDFLEKEKYTENDIQIICDLILATQLGYEPKNNLEACIKDADFSHFADSNYNTICSLLRQEFKNCLNFDYTDLEWALVNRDFMAEKHQYYTNYAKKNWQPLKDHNLKNIDLQIKQLKENITPPIIQDTDEKVEKTVKTKKAKQQPARGIETMFRITINNHTRLSDIADSKANILLSVNAIIISVCLSSLIPKLDSPSNAHLIYPTFVLLISSVATIIFAILSTKPKVTSGTFSQADINNRKVNLLFFGNFHKMPLEDYSLAMNEMMKDREYLYDSMIRDLYFLGLVLHKKYKLLRITYIIFMVGILSSVLTFIWAFIEAGF